MSNSLTISNAVSVDNEKLTAKYSDWYPPPKKNFILYTNF